jgi:hypothetical protein
MRLAGEGLSELVAVMGLLQLDRSLLFVWPVSLVVSC